MANILFSFCLKQHIINIKKTVRLNKGPFTKNMSLHLKLQEAAVKMVQKKCSAKQKSLDFFSRHDAIREKLKLA